jgi:hypothetical protein
MTSRTMPAIAWPAGQVRTRKHLLPAVVHASWTAFRERLARLSARRRLARSIAHLDDRMLADAGLSPEHRGVGDHLLRHFAAASGVFSANAVQR